MGLFLLIKLLLILISSCSLAVFLPNSCVHDIVAAALTT